MGSAGSGVGQFAALSSAPGFDAQGRIYVADAGNRWIARFDDLNFTNWTTLSQSQPVGPYIFLFGGPIGVVTDPAGKIYVADGTNVIRVDDMTGANWTSISVGTFAPHTIAIDSSGMVVLGNGYNAQIVDSEAAVLTSNIRRPGAGGLCERLRGGASILAHPASFGDQLHASDTDVFAEHRLAPARRRPSP